MAKFNVGDTVEVVSFGDGFAEEAIGDIHIISKCDPLGYMEGRRGIGYQVEEEDINPNYDGWVGEESFKLATSNPNVPENINPNVKMIQTFVPTWAKWMAMDEFGYWIVLKQKPKPNKDGHWVTKGLVIKVGKSDPKDIQVDWKETLHEI